MTTTTRAIGQHFRRHTAPYLLAGLLLLALLYLLYRDYQHGRQIEEQRRNLQEQVKANQMANDRRQLTFGMKAFVWAVRNALLQNKAGEIDEYFNTMVRNKGVREVLLVDSTGQVTLSTNKKNQGAQFIERFPSYLLHQQDVYFVNNVSYELSAPITAPNERLGTLVMFYSPTPYALADSMP